MLNVPSPSIAAAGQANAPEGSRLPTLLQQNASRMNFFRFCALLEQSLPDMAPIGTTDSPADEPVRFRCWSGLGFPASEIRRVDEHSDDPLAPPVVRTTFLGLYGVDARMPASLVDAIAQQADGTPALAAFLDLFHHRVVTQYYRAGCKYRLSSGGTRKSAHALSRHLSHQSGLDERVLQPVRTNADARNPPPVPRSSLLSLLDTLGQRTRTEAGLATSLRRVVDAHIRIDTFHPVWRDYVGSPSARLGDGCLLGGRFCDRSNAVRIVLVPRTQASLLALVPGGQAHDELMTVLRSYLGYQCSALIEVHIAAGLMPSPVLMSEQARLGMTTQLAGWAVAGEEPSMTKVEWGHWRGTDASTTQPEKQRQQ